MGLRPVPARWFEALVTSDDVSRAMEALARSGAVEIECQSDDGARAATDIAEPLGELEKLARRYHVHWPEDGAAGTTGSPKSVLDRALGAIHAWSKDVDPVIAEIEACERERADLQVLAELCEAAGDQAPELRTLGTVGPTLAARVLAFPRGQTWTPEPPPGVILRRWVGAAHELVVVVGSASALTELEPVAIAARARRVELPSFPLDAGSLGERRLAIDERLARARARIEQANATHRLADALADFRRLSWFVRNVPPLPHTRHFARVTGWTTDVTGARLGPVLEQSEVPALLHFPEPPAGRTAPTTLSNPSWIRPFETFARMLGTPGPQEADPSPLLALIAPLMFGFMFGDVAHGLILIVVGLVLGRRYPATRMLVWGGAAAALFGLLYGCVLTREDWIDALWLHPLHEPLTLLAASVVGGAVVLTLGLLLGAVQAWWQRALGRWLLTDAPLILVYLGLLGLLRHPGAGLVALAAAVWFVVGASVAAPAARPLAALGAVGHLVERTLQLLINTVSFARVGAFSLAHAGLCAAVVAVSDGIPIAAGALAVALVGNLLILVLEGLAVSIQTTRLVLFEFFVRFLRGVGRPFRPLLPPSSLAPSEGAPLG